MRRMLLFFRATVSVKDNVGCRCGEKLLKVGKVGPNHGTLQRGERFYRGITEISRQHDGGSATGTEKRTEPGVVREQDCGLRLSNSQRVNKMRDAGGREGRKKRRDGERQAAKARQSKALVVGKGKVKVKGKKTSLSALCSVCWCWCGMGKGVRARVCRV
ncbi:hypothetical protein BGZ63DRAFT_33997 [Mariannaea sp. PMI_226]|nr:hypothetical protein BGZ63DRAFT_33997 [Mariannaea sp. PMI_226]